MRLSAFGTLPRVAAVAAVVFAAPLLAQNRAAKGPVSISLERKNVQTLADGTHITCITHETYIRDSQGRVRTESDFGAMPGAEVVVRQVAVIDPVDGVRYNWQVGAPNGRKFYSVWRQPAPANGGSNSLMRTLPDGASGARQGIVTGSMGSGSTGSASRISQSTPAIPLPIVSSSAAQRIAALQPVTTRDPLGMRVVGGLTCTVQRTTTVYPVGFLGNDRPITATDEACLSEEAGRVIEQTQEDPRTGVQTVTLLSGSLMEPDVSLFQPPADYTERVQAPQGKQ